jgi:CheY-like chemotaxis protein
MPDGGRITIETSNVEFDEMDDDLHGKHVRVVVRDTGTGMTSEVLERAFEPFFTTKPTGEGTGLGLATVYGIVMQARGRIRLDSHPGAGTTATVDLPASALPATPAVVPHAEPVVPTDGVVLLVEDEPAVRRMTERILAENGYQVVVAASGAEAVKLCESAANHFDLLLTDVVMPQMFGTEVVERATALRPGIAVLYMSGYMDQIVTRQIVEARGSEAVIEKPFSAPVLLKRVRGALESAGAHPARRG